MHLTSTQYPFAPETVLMWLKTSEDNCYSGQDPTILMHHHCRVKGPDQETHPAEIRASERNTPWF